MQEAQTVNPTSSWASTPGRSHSVFYPLFVCTSSVDGLIFSRVPNCKVGIEIITPRTVTTLKPSG